MGLFPHPKILSETACQTQAEHTALLGKEGSENIQHFKTVGLDQPLDKAKYGESGFLRSHSGERRQI